MGVEATLVMWPRPSEQTFVSPPNGSSACNLVSICPAVPEEKSFEKVTATESDDTDADDRPLSIL